MKSAWFLGVGLMALAAGAWLGRGEPWMRWASGLGARLTQAAQEPAGGGRQAGGLHKCLQGDRVLYTDGPCPPGSRSQGVAGSLSVVPATPSTAAASAPDAARPALRQLDSGELRQRQMDAVINQ